MSYGDPLTQDEALALLRRTCDDNWLAGMLAQPEGQAIINQMCAVGEASSQSVMEQVAACIISTAPTGSPGRCTLTLSRMATGRSATVPKGFRFVTSIGVDLVVSCDVPIAIGQSTVVLPLVTLRQLDLVNTTEPAFDDLANVGDPADALCWPDDSPVLDNASEVQLGPSGSVLTYASSTSITGATMDWLSQHGDERGCRRQPGEDGEAYRARIRQLPDAVTPTAVQEAVQGAQVQGVIPTTYMVEPYRDQATDDARMAIGLVFADSYFADSDYADDPFGADLPGKLPWRTLECPSIREGRAYFRESVDGPLHEPDGLVLYADVGYCDDPLWGYPDIGLVPAQPVAISLPGLARVLPAGIYASLMANLRAAAAARAAAQPPLISLHPTIMASLRTMVEEARVKRAGGVQTDFSIENGRTLSAIAAVAMPGNYIIWTLTPAAGKAWLLRQGLLTCDAGGAIDPATDSYAVRITLADGSIVYKNTSAIDGMPLRNFELGAAGYFGTPVVKIEGIVQSTASKTMNLVGTFWVTDFTL